MANLTKFLEEAQKQIMEYSIAEAKMKMEKAETELETARLQQLYARQLMTENSFCSYGKRRKA